MLDLSPKAVAAAAEPRLVPAEGGHLLWPGPLIGEAPYIKLGASHRSVRRAWWVAHGGTLTRTQRVRNRCGTARCVALPHQWDGIRGAAPVPPADDTDAALLVRIAHRLTRDNGHWLWPGYLKRAVPTVRAWRQALPSDVSLRRVAWRAAGLPLEPRDYLLNACGQERCIEPDHQERVPRGQRALRARQLRRLPPLGEVMPARPSEAFVTWTELQSQAPFSWQVWPAEPPYEKRGCAHCGRDAWTRPGYVPFCERHDEGQYAEQGAMARRARVWGV